MESHDAIVIGAGFAGLYAVHTLRDGQGMDVVAFDAADGVGGTWYWNRYPGARVDIESVHYSYSFDDALQQEWHWTEKFCAQPEILAYLEHVADRYDLRRSIRFSTRITSLTWDDATSRWTAVTDGGQVHQARFVISGAGTLSVPKTPDFPGVDSFAGEVLMTGNWPHEDVSFAGKRVGIIGVGSSGIQAISEIAKTAGHLTVLQRTPNYATPSQRADRSRAGAAERADYAAIRDASRNHFLGVPTATCSLRHWPSRRRSAARSSTTAGTAAASACSSTPSATSCSTRTPTTPSRSTSAAASASGSPTPRPPNCWRQRATRTARSAHRWRPTTTRPTTGPPSRWWT